MEKMVIVENLEVSNFDPYPVLVLCVLDLFMSCEPHSLFRCRGQSLGYTLVLGIYIVVAIPVCVALICNSG